MVNKEFFKSAEEVAVAKNISIEEVYEIFKNSLVAAFKKANGNSSCRALINPEKNEIKLYAIYFVVEDPQMIEEPDDTKWYIDLATAKSIKASAKIGDCFEKEVSIKDFGRSAVGAAKGFYIQNSRTLEREKAYEHFKALEEEMITAKVSNIVPGKYILDLGFKVTAALPESELLANDKFEIGDSIKVYIKKVEQTTKDPKITVSRNDRQLVIRLMENYIPEIKDGTIEIKGIARDAGDRSKIALFSNNSNVDAIGSCVGEAGSRIRQIVEALGGEKVDLYKWSEDPEELITNSLQPASVTKVLEIDPKAKTSRVVVPDEHLSLAIGKQGQNVRLAVQSCGWKIDIIPTSKAFEEGLLI